MAESETSNKIGNLQERDRLSSVRMKIASLQEQLGDLESENKAMETELKPLTTLFSWQSAERAYTEHSKTWYLVVTLLFMLGIVAAALLKEMFLILALIATMILIFLSTSIKPNIATHEVTNKGIQTGAKLFKWEMLKGVWISKLGQAYQLVIDLEQPASPDRLIVQMGIVDPHKLLKILLDHTTYVPQKDINLDIISVFTLGEYLPITTWMEDEK